MKTLGVSLACLLSVQALADPKSACEIGGTKTEYAESKLDELHHHFESTKAKCWKDGVLVDDLVFDTGKRTGFHMHFQGDEVFRESYRDEKLDGEQSYSKGGKLVHQSFLVAGEAQWRKELFPSGKLKSYSRNPPPGAKTGFGSLRQSEDGRVQALECRADLAKDEVLRTWCGFGSASTVTIYDGTGKVSRIVTYKDGVLQKEAHGDSTYARGADVSYKDGKKHGEERIVDSKTGALKSTISWSMGVQDGKERTYSDDGKEVVKEQEWKSGVLAKTTELYLNGNPKLVESHDTPTQLSRREYWDTGKLKEESFLVAAPAAYDREWLEEGTHKTWYENGARESEASFKKGRQDGTSTSWFENGKPASIEEYAAGTRTKAKRWDKDGKLVLDEEYEADGSRKLHR